VLPSLFEEQVEQEANSVKQYTDTGPGGFAAMMSYLPSAGSYRVRPHDYLEAIRKARDAVSIPLIASLNGVTGAKWTQHARLAQEAGASAIELNVFFIPADPSLVAERVEHRYVEVLRAVKSAVSIPVAVKLSPYFTAPAHTVRLLSRAGADGFVLFNRFYQPDIDLDRLRLRHDLELSAPVEIRLPLLWLGVLFGQVPASLAASTGVDTGDEVVKYLLAGADVVMTASAFLRHGIGHLRALLGGLTEWMTAHDFAALSDIRGRLSLQSIKDPIAYQRVNYVKILKDRSLMAKDDVVTAQTGQRPDARGPCIGHGFERCKGLRGDDEQCLRCL